MPGLLSHVDPDGFLEYSVVFTDRSLNHMSKSFQQVMNDISRTLKKAYNAKAVALVPGGGTPKKMSGHSKWLVQFPLDPDF